jgi:hypothetical protein
MTQGHDVVRRTVLYAAYCLTASAAAGAVLMGLLAGRAGRRIGIACGRRAFDCSRFASSSSS